MDDMKNLIIQSLETKGVLGQIRAQLRSAVFKVVDEQDQIYNLGCGLKWENPTLYKILKTKIGTLLSEIIREFMEYFRMDYSLSIFIPECGISPERLKKEEILSKMGCFNEQEEFLSKLQMPLLYYIIYYFLDKIKNDPKDVFNSLKTCSDDVEKKSDELIDNNILEYLKNHRGGEDDELPISGDRNFYDGGDIISKGEVNDYEGNEGKTKEKVNNLNDNNLNNNNGNDNFDNDDLDLRRKRSVELDDRLNKNRGGFSLDDDHAFSSKDVGKDIKNDSKVNKEKESEDDKKNNIDEDIEGVGDIEIEEDIPDSIEQSAGKSSNTNTVSKSGLNDDKTVDSAALEKYPLYEENEKK